MPANRWRRKYPPAIAASSTCSRATPTLGADRVPLAAGQIAWFDPSAADGDDTVTIFAGAPLRVLLYAGPPIEEPVAFGGPFVMNTEEEIHQAFMDYRTGNFLG